MNRRHSLRNVKTFHSKAGSWKLTDEDWRNREKWDDYECAVDEMVLRTGTDDCLWTLVEAKSKRLARLKVIRTLCERLEERLR